MESPLVILFLGVIALTALLQAAFVAALAFGMRLGGLKLGLLEARFEATVVPQIRNAARLTRTAASLSERSLAHAVRVDRVLAATSRKAERHLDAATVRFEGAVERAALRVDAAIDTRTARFRDHRVLRKLGSVAAFLKGVQRALEVWESSAGAAGADDLEPDDGAPGDPSPA
jgi:hypothetical protein